MINRPTSRLISRILFVSLLTFCGGSLLNSCTSTEALPQAQDFATFRVLNMAVSDTTTGSAAVPYDVYVSPGAYDSLPQINALAFGQASVYQNNLPAASGSGTTYNIKVTPLHDRSKTYVEIRNYTFLQGHHYTLVIYRDLTNSNNLVGDLIEDDVTTDAMPQTNTYVRFLNTMPNTNLQMHIGDPLNGMLLGTAQPFKGNTGYIPIPVGRDSSFTVFITNAGSDSIIARLAFVSFSAGSFHTLTYIGDPLRYAPHRTGNNALDSLRIRVFDDNNIGNDQTFPIPLSFRFNIINGLLPSAAMPADYLGFLINNEGDPKFHGFAFNPTPTFGVASQAVDTVNGALGFYNSYLTNGSLTDAIELKGIRTDPAGDNLGAVFDVTVPDRTKIISDQAYSFVVYDTATAKINTSSALFKMKTVPLPDQPIAGTARIIIVNGLSQTKGLKATDLSTSISVNGTATTLQSAFQGRNAEYDVTSLPDVGQDVTVAVTSIGSGSTKIAPGPSIVFHADAGGIYEVVLLGQRPSAANPNPASLYRFIALRVNPIKK